MKKKYTLTILGCGSSPGVPTIDLGWGDCDSSNLKNIRTRASSLLNISYEPSSTEHISKSQLSSFNILFDAGPDFRQQALANKLKQIDSLFLTHLHADHIYGIDDLRSINRMMKKSIPLYATQETLEAIYKTHYYIFENLQTIEHSDKFYKPSLEQHCINYYDKIILNQDISVQTTLQNHGRINSLGLVIDNTFAYITDFVQLSARTIDFYKNLELIVIAAVTSQKHQSHMNIFEIIELLKVLKPKKAILTHMSEQLDYNYLCSILPANTIPAYDGFIINF